MSRNPVFRLTISREIELLAGELAIESESEGDKNEEQHAYPTPSTDRRAGKKNHVTLMTQAQRYSAEVLRALTHPKNLNKALPE